jgi:hypothetical protein
MIDQLRERITKIKNSILKKEDASKIMDDIKVLVQILKDENIYDESFDKQIKIFESKGKSKTRSISWISKAKKEMDKAMEIILEGVKQIVLQQQPNLGAEETKGSEDKAEEEEEDLSRFLPMPPSGIPVLQPIDTTYEADAEEEEAEEEETSGAGYYRGGALGDGEEDLIDAADEEINEPFQELLSAYNFYRLKLYQDSLSSLKEKPIFSKADVIFKTSKLQNYEGSASNVLRDILMTTISMTSNIKNNRVNLNAGISVDSNLVNSIKTDNDVIMNRFIPVLAASDEIERYYSEPFDKVLNNLKYINAFVGEL